MSVIEKAVAILRKDTTATTKSVSSTMPDSRMSSSRGSTRSANLMCQLDFNALQESGYITSGNDNTQFAEEYRLIKRPLLANAFGKGAAPVDMGNLVMITSSIPGEGKTFTSINLALSIALERDTTVLLIDADVVNPTLSRLFSLDKQPGLIDIIDDVSSDLSEVIINTDNPKLRIIPAGQLHAQSTELLASDRMRILCEELSARYPDRIIIFDSPPFLNTTQSKVLMRFMGQVMIVVEAGETHKTAIIEMTEQLDNNKVVGMILNKCKISKKGIYGGYYGSYGE